MPKRKVSLEGTQPKPSLASLKPDIVKGAEAAKKRAVKRIVATASVKASATRIKKISDAFPLPVVLKTSSKNDIIPGVTTPTLKARSNKTVEKVSSLKVATSAAAKSKVSVRTPLKESRAEAVSPHRREFAVRLPSNMSIRAREKALVLLQQAVHDFEKPAQQIAHVAGVCFIILGSYLALSFTGLLPGAGPQSAMLMQTAGTTSPTSLETSKDFNAPVFTLIEKIPAELTANAQYTFSLTHVKNVVVKIFSITDASQVDAAVDELVPGTRRYTLEAGKLKPGSYIVKATADAEAEIGRYTYELGEFSVPQPSGAIATSTGTSTAEQSVATTTKVAATASSTQHLTEVHSNMRLIADAELSGQKTIQISAPKDARFVEIYVRPVRSINARFLGLAEKKSENWYYFFNTINVPNGDYELFARTHINDSFFESNSVNTRIVNIAQFEMPDVNDGSQPLEEGQTIDDVATPVRTFSDYSFADASTSESVGGDVAAEADIIFAQHNTELNEVLKRYSVAVQSGDELLTKTALEELFKLKDQILLEVLNDSSRNYLADNISLEFDDRLESIKKRIATFEELRRTAGTEGVKLDLDKDGISDFDERNLYHTDPEQTDTDNDGVTDGIEIMRGFDPRSPLGESVINYELPQGVLGLAPNDSLHIDSVEPLVNHLSDTESIVQAEIHGLALPNSYVTLYVFSTPSITTVRTNDKGEFSYTFEKQLEDGEHEVYAAVTDNSGKLVAVSAPYKFVKRAQTFVAAGSVETGTQTVSLGDFTQFNASNAIIGIGIIALGIILLVLGSSLRRREVEGHEDVVPFPKVA